MKLLLSAWIAYLACLGCAAPSPIRMLPLARHSRPTLDELQERWGVPLVIVRGVIYAPPAECLPLADAATRARVAELSEQTAPFEHALVLTLPCHPVGNFHEYEVRGAGYRRVRSFDGERLRVERDKRVLYRPSGVEESGAGESPDRDPNATPVD